MDYFAHLVYINIARFAQNVKSSSQRNFGAFEFYCIEYH